MRTREGQTFGACAKTLKVESINHNGTSNNNCYSLVLTAILFPHISFLFDFFFSLLRRYTTCVYRALMVEGF